MVGYKLIPLLLVTFTAHGKTRLLIRFLFHKATDIAMYGCCISFILEKKQLPVIL